MVRSQTLNNTKPQTLLAQHRGEAHHTLINTGLQPGGGSHYHTSAVLTASLRPSTLLTFLILLTLLTLPLTGCVSKAKAKADAQAAFLAGQQQGIARMQRLQAGTATVTVLGQVNNSSVPWTEELTVAKAIVAAGYLGTADPSHIILIRNGQATQVDPRQLLTGHDLPVLPGDLIQLAQ